MKQGILLAAYGSTTLQEGQQLSFIQKIFEDRFQLPVRWALSSYSIRTRLALRHTKSDSVLKALEKMRFERYTQVFVQPLHIAYGKEYAEVKLSCTEAEMLDNFSVKTAPPLLSDNAHIPHIATALLRHIPEERKKEETVLYMAHGSKSDSGRLYSELGKILNEVDSNAYIACLVGTPTLNETLSKIKEKRTASKKIHLLPLLTLIGKHTLNDMAGVLPTSWKSVIEKDGFVCTPHLMGLASDLTFIQIWTDRLQTVISE